MPLYFPVLNELNISHIASFFTDGGKIYYKVINKVVKSGKKWYIFVSDQNE